MHKYVVVESIHILHCLRRWRNCPCCCDCRCCRDCCCGWCRRFVVWSDLMQSSTCSLFDVCDLESCVWYYGWLVLQWAALILLCWKESPPHGTLYSVMILPGWITSWWLRVQWYLLRSESYRWGIHTEGKIWCRWCDAAAQAKLSLPALMTSLLLLLRADYSYYSMPVGIFHPPQQYWQMVR